MKTIGYVLLGIFLWVIAVVIVAGLIGLITKVLNWWLVGFVVLVVYLECISQKATKTNELLAKLVEIKGGGE